ncbi:MAG: hypothetical protein IPO92_13795 [Saprospiraceae bacterium]|nr:hypothetical protein [Saprospiraceae bacterium]
MKSKLYQTLTLTSFLLSMFFYSIDVKAQTKPPLQEIIHTTLQGTVIKISGLPGPHCAGNVSGKSTWEYNFQPFLFPSAIEVGNALNISSKLNFMNLNYTDEYEVTVDITHASYPFMYLTPLEGGLDEYYLQLFYGAEYYSPYPPYQAESKNFVIKLSPFKFDKIHRNANSIWKGKIKIPYASRTGFVLLEVKEEDLGSIIFPAPLYNTFLAVPAYIEGSLEKTVARLGDITRPQVPYMVLHDPPGDGSFTELLKSKKTCRNVEDTYSTENSTSTQAGVKVGAGGEFGPIEVEVSIEASTTDISGKIRTTVKGLETCVTIDEGFQTSDVPGLKDGSDVFIGFGEKMSYGKFKNLEFDGSSCEPVEKYRLIYAPIVGSQTPFSFTLDGIKNEIVNNQLIVDNLSKTLRQRNDAQYQINAWNRIIQLNEDNKNNPANVPKYPPQNFSAGLMKTLSTTISVANTSSLTLESYIENENELKGVAEVNGNGFNGSYKITNKKRFGATNSATSSTDDMIKITLKDDDLGDKFDMEIVGDAMFGTPVFRLKDAGTKSSCPFEGGYKRDQPSISQPFYAPTSWRAVTNKQYRM